MWPGWLRPVLSEIIAPGVGGESGSSVGGEGASDVDAGMRCYCGEHLFPHDVGITGHCLLGCRMK
ncbi:MAG: hypothetical protein RLZZ282_1567 [Verrucomicrobiota bacterium]